MRGGQWPAPPVPYVCFELHVTELVPSLREYLRLSLDFLVARVVPVGLEVLDDELGLRDELLPVVRLGDLPEGVRLSPNYEHPARSILREIGVGVGAPPIRGLLPPEGQGIHEDLEPLALPARDPPAPRGDECDVPRHSFPLSSTWPDATARQGESEEGELNHEKCPRKGFVASPGHVREGDRSFPMVQGKEGAGWWGFRWPSARQSPSRWPGGTPRPRRRRRGSCQMSSALSRSGPDGMPAGPSDRRCPERRKLPANPGGGSTGQDVIQALRVVWATMNGPAGKRLAPFMAEIVEALERHGELPMEPGVRTKLLAMSSATIDRALAPERRRLRVKGRSGTKPGSILKRQIPIRTFAEWDEGRPGFCEVDLVAHDGGSPYGEFCQTLDLTCVATGWTEPRALRNKAQRWVNEAIDDIAAELPFPLLGLDSDNGAEFINMQLYGYCEERGITFTRSRPYRKNDNCYVEQKNWPVVRQQVGYARYDTPAELRALRDLYRILRLFVNYFQPQMT